MRRLNRLIWRIERLDVQLQARPPLASGLDLAALVDRLAGKRGYPGNFWSYTPIPYSETPGEVEQRIRERMRDLDGMIATGAGQQFLADYNAILLSAGQTLITLKKP